MGTPGIKTDFLTYNFNDDFIKNDLIWKLFTCNFDSFQKMTILFGKLEYIFLVYYTPEERENNLIQNWLA